MYQLVQRSSSTPEPGFGRELTKRKYCDGMLTVLVPVPTVCKLLQYYVQKGFLQRVFRLRLSSTRYDLDLALWIPRITKST